MKYTKRILSFLGLAVVWAAGPWFVAIPWCVFHVVWFRGVEVVVVAIAVDALYSTSVTVPWYTIGTVCGVVTYEWLRTRIFIYNE